MFDKIDHIGIAVHSIEEMSALAIFSGHEQHQVTLIEDATILEALRGLSTDALELLEPQQLWRGKDQLEPACFHDDFIAHLVPLILLAVFQLGCMNLCLNRSRAVLAQNMMTSREGDYER